MNKVVVSIIRRTCGSSPMRCSTPGSGRPGRELRMAELKERIRELVGHIRNLGERSGA